MKQNTSSAVMEQRGSSTDELDDFPTPPWATRAMCELILAAGFAHPDDEIWEPTANRLFMVRALKEFFNTVWYSDVFQYPGTQYQKHDFAHDPPFPVDWVITNPPFKLAEQFIRHALTFARKGVAMLVRSAFMEGVGRYQRLFKDNPPTIIYQFVERVPMVKGRYDIKASTATSYCWCVWVIGEERRPTEWIPPSRKRLERLTDALHQ